MFAIGFGSNSAVAVGEKGLQRISFDGGHTFRKPDEAFSRPMFLFQRDLVFGDDDRGWIVGAKGLVMRTSDGGLTWHQVLPPPQDGVPEDGAGE